ncbi:MAG: hypothetical protein K0M70_03205 [Arenimonas sp.]|uniref:hypothetical protein n=1 Tax=Arenimonas sp. TaxID=1872635 RepID=UPI0025C5C9ED|nr:hypothetical protein [Arenimonas sp.]MBW8366850.1 hypothetical protein [Arenimonas sp.]
MIGNPISFIFKIGKHASLPFRPLLKLGAIEANPVTLLPTSRVPRKNFEKAGPPSHSNQMSS